MRNCLFPVGWSYCSSRRLLSVLVMYDVDILILRYSEPCDKIFPAFFPKRSWRIGNSDIWPKWPAQQTEWNYCDRF